MLRLLTCLAAHYPSAGYDDATLVLLAEDWAEEQRRALPRPVPDEEAERTRCLNRIAGIRARLGRREAYGGNPSPCRASRAPRGTA